MLAQKNKKEHTIVIQTGNRLDEIKVTIVTCISNLGKTTCAKSKLTQRFWSQTLQINGRSSTDGSSEPSRVLPPCSNGC